MAAPARLSSDTYNTIKAPATGEYREKGSRFLAFAYPVHSEEEIVALLKQLRERYHDARHHCYAWALGPQRSSSRMNDDGEPSGTAGRPIFGQILSFDLTNVLLVVVRYFGGTLLGVGGLAQAYKAASREAISSAQRMELQLEVIYELRFPYELTRDVQRILREEHCRVVEEAFGASCSCQIAVRQSLAGIIQLRLSSVQGLQVIKLSEDD